MQTAQKHRRFGLSNMKRPSGIPKGRKSRQAGRWQELSWGTKCSSYAVVLLVAQRTSDMQSF